MAAESTKFPFSETRREEAVVAAASRIAQSKGIFEPRCMSLPPQSWNEAAAHPTVIQIVHLQVSDVGTHDRKIPDPQTPDRKSADEERPDSYGSKASAPIATAPQGCGTCSLGANRAPLAGVVATGARDGRRRGSASAIAEVEASVSGIGISFQPRL